MARAEGLHHAGVVGPSEQRVGIATVNRHPQLLRRAAGTWQLRHHLLQLLSTRIELALGHLRQRIQRIDFEREQRDVVVLR